MKVHSGIGVGPGYAIGEVFLLRRERGRVPVRAIAADDVDRELARIASALERVQGDLETLRRDARLTPEVEAILATHEMILADPTLRSAMEQGVREGRVAAESAASAAIDAIVARFEALPDPYFQQRSTDVRDIGSRIHDALRGHARDELERTGRTVVIAAHELAPSEAALLDGKWTLGFLTDLGGPTSHTAIIARSRGLPAVVGLGDVVSELVDGTTVVVDGNRGEVVVDPDPAQLARYRDLAARYARWVRDFAKIRDFPAETRDGHTLRLNGNIEVPDEVDSVIRAGGDGIGLFRTEFLFVPGRPAPTEDDHFRVYTAALRKLGDRPLTVRTFDFGADKAIPDGSAEPEPNPALGVRSLRLCLERPDLFLPQLRAILRAAGHGNLRCLFPMVSGVGELLRAKEMLDRARMSLRSDGVVVPERLPVGVMIEIPSAAIVADLLVDHVDFFSIGSNDLIQYALAVDRVNARVAHLYEPAHPALLRLIGGVVRVAEDRGRPVSLCGEVAGDRLFTVLLVGMGFREFSISPRALPEIKQAIRSITVEQAREAAAWCLAAGSAAEVRDRLREITREHLPAF